MPDKLTGKPFDVLHINTGEEYDNLRLVEKILLARGYTWDSTLETNEDGTRKSFRTTSSLHYPIVKTSMFGEITRINPSFYGKSTWDKDINLLTIEDFLARYGYISLEQADLLEENKDMGMIL